MVSLDPNRPDFEPSGFSCGPSTPSPMKRPDHHNEIEVNLLTKGWVTYLCGRRKIDYLTRDCVSPAQRLLATTDEKIVDVAFSPGFNSISRFNEAFRRACRCTS